MAQIIMLAIAGALGTLSRHALGNAVHRLSGDAVWGTWAVNILGCFLFGVATALAEKRLEISNEMRLIILTGFMGAFTTFSTFIFETGNMIRSAQWGPALVHAAGQILVGMVFLFLGLTVAQRL
ncbi:MAG: fluoride efflux transporter CrcB [Anaerolineae bacterium]